MNLESKTRTGIEYGTVTDTDNESGPETGTDNESGPETGTDNESGDESCDESDNDEQCGGCKSNRFCRHSNPVRCCYDKNGSCTNDAWRCALHNLERREMIAEGPGVMCSEHSEWEFYWCWCRGNVPHPRCLHGWRKRTS